MSFVSRCHITDNVVRAQEANHAINCTTGEKGHMEIKVDLEKAYDHLN